MHLFGMTIRETDLTITRVHIFPVIIPQAGTAVNRGISQFTAAGVDRSVILR